MLRSRTRMLPVGAPHVSESLEGNADVKTTASHNYLNTQLNTPQSTRHAVRSRTGLMVSIRRVAAADQQRVLDIWRGAVDATHHFLTPDDRRDIDTEVVAFLPQAPLWLAVDDNDYPLGFMLLEAGNMETRFIDPLKRGLGIGRTLVQNALTFYSTITTDVNEQNTQAMGFYAHIGFKRIGRSQTDNQGRAYPLIHMRMSGTIGPLSNRPTGPTFEGTVPDASTGRDDPTRSKSSNK
jgi:putative acetyltransferase